MNTICYYISHIFYCYKLAASVWILDNSYIVCQGLKHIIERLGDFNIEFHSEPLRALKKRTKMKNCDILLCNSDFILNRQSITKLKIKNPLIKVLVIDDGKSEYKDYLTPATVDGYIMLYCHVKEILKAFTVVSHGKKFFCDTITNIIQQKKDKKRLQKPGLLSERETQILRLIANGLSSQEISKRLFVSFHTITTHRKNICKKLKVSKVSEVIASAYKMNIV